MIVSTRGRYALRVMVDLARNESGRLVPLKGIAERQGISLKYLEGIMTSLSKAGLVNAAHGKGGGYSLSRAPEDYTVGEILRVTEKSYVPIACLNGGVEECENAAECPTLPMWSELRGIIVDYFDNKRLSDLIKE